MNKTDCNSYIIIMNYKALNMIKQCNINVGKLIVKDL